MVTVVEVRSDGNDPQQHRVLGSVEDVAADVNSALLCNLRFVALTAEDGNQFSVLTDKVLDIRSAA